MIEVNKSNMITKDLYFIIIDNRENRKITSLGSNKKVKLSNVELQLSFFEGKALNSFWEYNMQSKCFEEISHVDFYKQEFSQSYFTFR